MKNILIILGIVIIAIGLCLFFVRNPQIDRFNPLLKEEVSYAKVPKEQSEYEGIQAYSKDGDPLKYKLDFIGYDRNKTYVKIFHKGQYVRQIEYLENDIPKFIK